MNLKSWGFFIVVFFFACLGFLTQYILTCNTGLNTEHFLPKREEMLFDTVPTMPQNQFCLIETKFINKEQEPIN